MRQHRGSRRHVLDWVEETSFVDEMNCLLGALPMRITAADLWMPKGWTSDREARLETFGPKAFPAKETWSQVSRWWLRHERGANTPNWDFASTASIHGIRGLLLVEAKANVSELSRSGKSLRPRKSGGEKRVSSKDTRENHEHIAIALAEAGQALKALGLCGELSVNSSYQLANRLAFAWKLASLGIPVTLLYLGFWGDRGINGGFSDAPHWYSTFRGRALPCLSMPEDSRTFLVSGTPLSVGLRAREVLTQSQ
jgi:hypothetical protein